jgi:hypothetical protein
MNCEHGTDVLSLSSKKENVYVVSEVITAVITKIHLRAADRRFGVTSEEQAKEAAGGKHSTETSVIFQRISWRYIQEGTTLHQVFSVEYHSKFGLRSFYEGAHA